MLKFWLSVLKLYNFIAGAMVINKVYAITDSFRQCIV